MTVSRRSFLTGAASCTAIAATGGIGAAGGGVDAAITAEDVAIARQYKSVFDTLRGKDAIAAGFERMRSYYLYRIDGGVRAEALFWALE